MAFEDPIDNPIEEVKLKSPEEAQKEEDEKTKTEQVRKMVSEYVPNYSNEDFLTAVAKQEGTTVEELTDEQREMAANAKFNHDWSVGLIVKNFIDANVPEQELPAYIAEVVSFEQDLGSLEKDKNRLDSRRYRMESITALSTSVDKLKTWRNLFQEWKTTLGDNETEETTRQKMTDFHTFANELSGRGRSPKPPERDEKEVLAQFAMYKEIKQLLYGLPDKLKNAPDKENFVKEFENSFFHLATESHSPEQAQIYFKLFKDCFDKNPETATTYMRVIKSYGRIHPLTEQAITGFETKLFPAIKNKDPQVELLQTQGNRWGMGKGDFGIADFAVHSYAVEIKPKNINELLMALRELPTSSFAKLEQNRKDALSLAGTFGALRDFIHDQRPLVREVVQAMVKYQETHDKTELATLLPKTEGYLKPDERQAMIFDLANYDKEVKTTVDGEQKQEKVIEVLKRLENNTRLVEETPPTTAYPELNTALTDVASGENFTSTEALQRAMDIVNGKLEQMTQAKEVGIEPNMVLAIAWLERQGYAILKNLTYEDQQGAYKKPWLHSILKFQELTASAQPFNAEEFHNFITKLSRAKDLKEAYKSVMNRTLRQVSDLATVYGKTNKSHISGALWSGNIAHELTALNDLKPATTTYGERHKKEQEVPLHLRNTGD